MRGRGGFTLIESMLSLALIAVLLTASTAVLTFSLRAVPQATGPRDRTLQSRESLERGVDLLAGAGALSTSFPTPSGPPIATSFFYDISRREIFFGSATGASVQPVDPVNGLAPDNLRILMHTAFGGERTLVQQDDDEGNQALVRFTRSDPALLSARAVRHAPQAPPAARLSVGAAYAEPGDRTYPLGTNRRVALRILPELSCGATGWAPARITIWESAATPITLSYALTPNNPMVTPPPTLSSTVALPASNAASQPAVLTFNAAPPPANQFVAPGTGLWLVIGASGAATLEGVTLAPDTSQLLTAINSSWITAGAGTLRYEAVIWELPRQSEGGSDVVTAYRVEGWLQTGVVDGEVAAHRVATTRRTWNRVLMPAPAAEVP